MGFHHKSISLAGTATLGPKGQVVIPVEAREKMHVQPGDKLIAVYIDEHKTISFIPETEMQSLIEKMGKHLTKLTDSFKKKG